MRYWWVNHKQTFQQEFAGGYVWCPKRFKDGRVNHFYETLREVRPGDLVLSYLPRIRQWREQGYHVSLFFLALPNAEAAIARVAERVKQGGHHIPDDVIRRRFAAGLRNFHEAYKSAVDAWALFDNMGEAPALVEWGEDQ
jgi:hypothetical protein